MDMSTVQAGNAKNKFAVEESGVTKLVDRVLDFLLHKIQKQNQPMPIEDTVIEFSKTFLCLPIKGEIEIRNVRLWGIDTITRPDDVDFEYDDPVAVIKSDFVVSNLQVTFDFQFAFNRRIHKGNITGHVTQLDLNLGLKINLAEETVEITQIELKNIEKLKIDIVSRKFAAKVVDIFLCIVTTASKGAVLFITEMGLHRVLGKKLPI